MKRLIVGALIIAILVGIGTTVWGFSSRVAGRSQDTPSSFPIPVAEPTQGTPRPEPTPKSPVPVKPWPPTDLRAEIIQLVLNDPETARLLAGHRYGVFSVNLYVDKSGPCSDVHSPSCVDVGLYDYAVPTGLKVVVNFATREVLDRRIVPEYQPGPSQEEVAEIANIIANAQGLGSGAKVDHAAGVSQISDTKVGGQCGTLSPLHRCLMVKVTQSNGVSLWVVVDMVERKVVRVQ